MLCPQPRPRPSGRDALFRRIRVAAFFYSFNVMEEVFPPEILVLALVSLAVSSLGWRKFVYFISLGYGFSVAAMGAAMIIMFAGCLTPVSVILCVLLSAYGCRLGGFLLHRELRSASYRKELPSLTGTSKDLGPAAKAAIWISVVVLYVCQVSPVLYRMEGTPSGESLPGAVAGASVMLAALVLEAVADHQKSAAKKIRPDRFCDTGLYRIVRCPNYFAEILFWTGCFISGAGALHGWQWLVSSIGYICIVYIMFGGARRLEIRQNRRYGEDPVYREYVSRTPVLIPFLPLYSVEKYTFLKG